MNAETQRRKGSQRGNIQHSTLGSINRETYEKREICNHRPARARRGHTGLRILIRPKKIFTTDAGLMANGAQGRSINSRMIGHRERGAGAVFILAHHRNVFRSRTISNPKARNAVKALALGASTGNFGMAA